MVTTEIVQKVEQLKFMTPEVSGRDLNSLKEEKG